MQKTARQTAGATVGSLPTPQANDRLQSMYHEKRKRTPLEWSMLVIVGIIAFVVISLSFKHTSEIAEKLDLPPFGTAFLVEVLFGSLLFLRARQRALQLNVPIFLTVGYYVSFIFVTSTNVYGLSIKNPILGPVFGIAISGAMWLMETTMVWLWTESHTPHEKSLRERVRETKKEIKEIKAIQRLEWMKWEAQNPDLKLIRDARRAEKKRKEVVGDGLPEFFTREPEPFPQIEAEPIVQDVEEEETEQAEIVPIKRQIGFQAEEPTPALKPAPVFQPNEKAREEAIRIAKELKEELGRIPKKRELVDKGVTDHYSRIAIKELKEELQPV